MDSQFLFDVFLSHSSKDKAVVRDVAERLREDGLRVWFDEWEIKPGDSIPAKIEEGLEHSRVLVLCMSASAFGADWVELEASTFRFRDPLNKDRRLVPLRLDDAPIKGSLAQFLYIRWRPEDRDQAYAKLLRACRPSPRTFTAEAPAAPEHVEKKAVQLDQSGDGGASAPSISNAPPLPRFVHPLLRARDWQERPEFIRLCDWWRKGAVGVCALIGIGGAGKTAMAERFLRVLPGGLPVPEGVAKDDTLPPPPSLFVFSFYDAPNPDHFFAHLFAWLNDAPLDEPPKAPSSQQTFQRLCRMGQVPSSQSTPILLVMDGLEKVQDDGAHGGAFGQILDSRLRELILRAAEGWLPGVAFLITTRFRLFDPLAQRSAFYCQNDADRLQPAAATALLRARGVARATDEQLLALAEESGFHALTLDLLGGWVATFCDGDPTRTPPLPEIGVPDEAAAEDPRLAAVKEQERRFARLTQRYRDVLSERDPAALALMERVCLFRLGVSADRLAAIFTGAGKESVSGPALAALDRTQVGKKLRMLAQMGLLSESKLVSVPGARNAHLCTEYTPHPAVRDGFLSSLASTAARLGHEAIRIGLVASLSERPGDQYPSDPATLDLLEEIIYHAIACGHTEDGWQIYTRKLGGYSNLGHERGEFERGNRILSALAGTANPREAVLQEPLEQGFFFNSWGLFLVRIGRTKAARLCFERSLKVCPNESASRHVTEHLGNVLLLSGHLKGALHAYEEARRLDRIWCNTSLYSEYYPEECVVDMGIEIMRACPMALLGQSRDALKVFKDVQKALETPAGALRGLLGLIQAMVLGRVGRVKEAMSIAEQCEKSTVEGRGLWVRAKLVLSDLARQRGDYEVALAAAREAHDWALVRSSREEQCWSLLAQARAQLHSSEESIVSETAKLIREGLLLARDSGYAIYHIDLMLARARLHLLVGEAESALADLHLALDDGVHPLPDSGYPELLAATDPACGYVWGIAEGRALRAQAILFQAAQVVGRAHFAPSTLPDLPAEVRRLIESARKELEECRKLRKRILDPKATETEQVIKDLEGGVLTRRALPR